MLSYLLYHIIIVTEHIFNNESIQLNRSLINTTNQKSKRTDSLYYAWIFFLIYRNAVDQTYFQLDWTRSVFSDINTTLCHLKLLFLPIFALFDSDLFTLIKHLILSHFLDVVLVVIFLSQWVLALRRTFTISDFRDKLASGLTNERWFWFLIDLGRFLFRENVSWVSVQGTWMWWRFFFF